MKSAKILMVYEGLPVLTLIAGALESQGHRVTVIRNGRCNAAALARKSFDLAILKLSGGSQASALLQRLKPRTKLIILSEDQKLPEEAYRREVAVYIFLPCRPAEIWRRIGECMEGLTPRPAFPKGNIQLHPVNRRVYQKLVSIFTEMATSIASLAVNMELLHQKVRDDDHELEDLCQQACEKNQKLHAIMKEIEDSFTAVKPMVNPAPRKSQLVDFSAAKKTIKKNYCREERKNELN